MAQHTQTNLSIGIDIGGTNTDAVLVDKDKQILATSKIPTHHLLEEGIKACIAHLLAASGASKSSIKNLYIGTTHATNAILEAKGLLKVGVIRLASHRSTLIDPCFKWPSHITQAAFCGVRTVAGGLRCDQKAMDLPVQKEVAKALKELLEQGMQSLAIVGTFSPLSSCQEQQVAAWAEEYLGDNFPITVSSQIGGMGIIERENAAILNAALKRQMAQAFENIETLQTQLGIKANLFMTQNDGSIINLNQAIQKPLLTISSGPTNSFIGAAKLASLQEAIIVDIGGTSADIGIVLNGYPRRSLGQAMIGDIPLNFRMPDVLSLPIGGGSVVRRSQNNFTLGPDSLGCRLFSEGCSFGGSTLTLTDAAYKAALLKPAAQHAVPLSQKEARFIIETAVARIQNAIRLMRGNKTHLPVIAVGGGAFFMDGIADHIPANSGIANAYGASLAEISYTIDTVSCLDHREKTLADICARAQQEAVNRGAEASTVRIVDMQVTPYHYIPGNLGKVTVTASGSVQHH